MEARREVDVSMLAASATSAHLLFSELFNEPAVVLRIDAFALMGSASSGLSGVL